MPLTALGQIKNQENKVRSPRLLITNKYVISNPCSFSGLVYSAPSRLHLSWGATVRALVSQQSAWNMQLFLLGAWPPSWILPGSSKQPCFPHPQACPLLLWHAEISLEMEERISSFSRFSTFSLSHSPYPFSLFKIGKFLSNHLEK